MANCFKIFNLNFIDLDLLGSATVTSEQADFPDEDLYNRQRRSKTWRSNGNYEVFTTNQVIRFRESVGVDLDATIALGATTSFAVFAARLKAALEIASGGSVFTITQNSNLRIKIASDRAGGGGLFELRTADAAFTAADLIGYDTGSNLADAADHTADFIRIHGTTGERLIWDMGLPTNPKYFVTTALRNEPLKISPSAVLKLEGNHTNNFNGTPAFSKILTYNDELIFSSSETGLHTEGLRYWSLQIIDRDSAIGLHLSRRFPTPRCINPILPALGRQIQDRERDR